MKLLTIILLACITLGASAHADDYYRPFGEYEKRLFVRGIQGHLADVITTGWALSDDRMIEGNGIVRTLIVDHEVEFVAVKGMMLCGTYLAAHATADPVWRRRILKTNIVAGWTPALWNIGLSFSF